MFSGVSVGLVGGVGVLGTATPISYFMYRFYKASILAVLVAASSVMVTSAVTAPPRETPTPGQYSSMVIQTDANGILAQCGDYFTFHPDTKHYGVVPSSYDKNYVPVPPMVVPVYGYMESKPMDVQKALTMKQGENPYSIAEINRALWDGNSFIWVAKEANADAWNYVKSFANTWNSSHDKKVIVLTWDGDKPLPLGRQYAFSSWGISQSCMSFSTDAFQSFMKQSDLANVGRDISALPTAPLTDGELAKF